MGKPVSAPRHTTIQRARTFETHDQCSENSVSRDAPESRNCTEPTKNSSIFHDRVEGHWHGVPTKIVIFISLKQRLTTCQVLPLEGHSCCVVRLIGTHTSRSEVQRLRHVTPMLLVLLAFVRFMITGATFQTRTYWHGHWLMRSHSRLARHGIVALSCHFVIALGCLDSCSCLCPFQLRLLFCHPENRNLHDCS